MKKVYLEISTLGLGQVALYEGYNKSGIYRVTDETIKNFFLHENSEFEINLLFNEFPYTSVFTEKYFQNLGIKHDKIIPNFNAKLLTNLLKLIPKHKFNYTLLNILSKKLLRINSSHHVKKADIVHSLYYPIPNYINKDKTICFRTIHDILPITHSHFFTRAHSKHFKKNILKNKNLTPLWFFAVSEFTKKQFCQTFEVDENRVFVTHLAADKSIFHAETDLSKIRKVKKIIGIPDDAEYFLNLSTIEPRKNIFSLVKAFKEFLSFHRSKDVYLVLSGKKGWLYNDIFDFVNSHPILQKHVKFIGFFPDNLLSPLYSGCLSFVFPSYAEGFGLPIIEAIQCGAPIITSNTTSLTEIAKDYAILIDPFNQEELSDAMNMVYQNNGNIRKWMKAKSLNASKKFSWNNYLTCIINGYKEALKKH